MATKRDRKTAFPFIKPKGSIKKDILQYRNQNGGENLQETRVSVVRRQSSAARFFKHLRPERNNPLYHSEGKGHRKHHSEKDRSRSFNEKDVINHSKIDHPNTGDKENALNSFKWILKKSSDKISAQKTIEAPAIYSSLKSAPLTSAPSSERFGNYVQPEVLEEADYVNVASSEDITTSAVCREPDLIRNLPGNKSNVSRNGRWKTVADNYLINRSNDAVNRAMIASGEPRGPMSIPWDWTSGPPGDDETNYARELRSSMAALLSKQYHVRQNSTNSTGSSYSSYSAEETKPQALTSVLNDSGYETFHQDLQFYCRQYGGWIDPDPSVILTSPPSNPPLPPVRDASSLKYVKCGRGIPEVFRDTSGGYIRPKKLDFRQLKLPAEVYYPKPEEPEEYNGHIPERDVTDYSGINTTDETPFIDQLRRDNENLVKRKPPGNFSNGRDSVATFATNSSNSSRSSGSSSSNDTMNCYGSCSDISITSGGSSRAEPIIVRSAKVPIPKRQQSESSFLLAMENRPRPLVNLNRKFSVNCSTNESRDQSSIDTSQLPSVQERIHQLERQSKSVPDLAARWRHRKPEVIQEKPEAKAHYERNRKTSEPNGVYKISGSTSLNPFPVTAPPPQRPPKKPHLRPRIDASDARRKPPAPSPPPSPPPPPLPPQVYRVVEEVIPDDPLPPPPSPGILGNNAEAIPHHIPLFSTATLENSVSMATVTKSHEDTEAPRSYISELRIPVPATLSTPSTPIIIDQWDCRRSVAGEASTNHLRENRKEENVSQSSPSDKPCTIVRSSILIPGPDTSIVANAVEEIATEVVLKSESPSTSPSKISSCAPLPASSVYFTISEPKAKLLTRYGQTMEKSQQLTEQLDTQILEQQKEDLMTRLEHKLEILRSERLMIQEEIQTNEALGMVVSKRISAVATTAESNKVALHVTEVDKITALLLALAGRLARAENALISLPATADLQERAVLEGKRDKLLEQLEEAKSLKENIDRRSRQVAALLSKYLTEEEFADYSHFVSMKAKLIMDAKEIDDKIKLGEEQLAALHETLHIRPKLIH